MKSLILGGTRSGKTRLAENMAKATHLPITYIATATALDSEMQARIGQHQLNRPADWQTIEEPIYLAQALDSNATDGRCIIIDCLTLWLTNLICADNTLQLAHETNLFVESLAKLSSNIIVVSNEIGLGVTPTGLQTRQFCDAIGVLHQTLANDCDRVILCIAGLPHLLKGDAP